MLHDTDDIAIIRQVLQGQQAAYAVLVQRYQSYVFTLAYRYVPQRELAEELAQDIFVKAYRCLADYKGNAKFSTWLYTIAHTTCVSHMRKKSVPIYAADQERMQELSETTQQHTLPATQLEAKDLQKALGHAIEHLPEMDAEIITLYYLAGQSIEEIAIITKLSANNVKVKLHRARQKLKEILSLKYPGAAL